MQFLISTCHYNLNRTVITVTVHYSHKQEYGLYYTAVIILYSHSVIGTPTLAQGNSKLITHFNPRTIRAATVLLRMHTRTAKQHSLLTALPSTIISVSLTCTKTVSNSTISIYSGHCVRQPSTGTSLLLPLIIAQAPKWQTPYNHYDIHLLKVANNNLRPRGDRFTRYAAIAMIHYQCFSIVHDILVIIILLYTYKENV